MDFDRIVVVSLARRPDRLAGFRARLGEAWPDGLSRLEVMAAIDGEKCPKPDWFTATAGAWGCYRSHQQILESSLDSGIDSVLIFEDDAAFVPDFPGCLDALLEALPGDWGQLYLGGQHLRPPEPVNECVVRAVNINRTHAYAIRGREHLSQIYRWLHSGDHWKGRHHVDHHYGRLHARRFPSYAPRQWLCGQAAGTSDVAARHDATERWWRR
jgi:hypothetical protein